MAGTVRALRALVARALARRPRLWPRSRLARRFALLFAVLGPGLIAANAGNDAGGIATYASVGAKYGYGLLWMMVVITVSLIVVQEMAARMGAVTGKGLAELIREQYGVRWSVFATVSVLIANLGICISEFVGIGAAPPARRRAGGQRLPVADHAVFPVAAGFEPRADGGVRERADVQPAGGSDGSGHVGAVAHPARGDRHAEALRQVSVCHQAVASEPQTAERRVVSVR